MTNYADAAKIIEGFVDGSCDAWVWDDFTSKKKKDAFLERVRQRCLSVHTEFPPVEKGYCSEDGVAVLRALARDLREKKEPNQSLDPTRFARGSS